jgi:hypothetical protein
MLNQHQLMSLDYVSPDSAWEYSEKYHLIDGKHNQDLDIAEYRRSNATSQHGSTRRAKPRGRSSN